MLKCHTERVLLPEMCSCLSCVHSKAAMKNDCLKHMNEGISPYVSECKLSVTGYYFEKNLRGLVY